MIHPIPLQQKALAFIATNAAMLIVITAGALAVPVADGSIEAISLVYLFLELILHLVEQAHYVIEIWLNLLFHKLAFVVLRRIMPTVLTSFSSAPLRELLQLVTLI